MMVSVERNKVGLAAGSSTVEDDWKDWKRPVMLRFMVKLFRNKTKLEIAVLNRTSNVSS